MQDEKRLEQLEVALIETQKSMLLMSKDIDQITKSINSIAESLKSLARVQQDVRIMEERNENRYIAMKDRIEELEKENKEGLRPKTLKYFLYSTASFLIIFGTWVTIMVYAIDKAIDVHIAEDSIKYKEYEYRSKERDQKIDKNKNQITYLKGRIKK